ncbi:MAG: VC0807 family protein [Bdellovibrionales bacterium]
MEANQQKNDMNNAFLNLLLNIVLPVVILNYFSDKLGPNGPVIALGAALSFPIAYAIYEYRGTKKLNIFSVFGFVNVLFTGGFALMKLEGFWFAVKEGAFPLIIGIFVWLSVTWKKPLIKLLLFNEQLFDVDKIQRHLDAQNTSEKFDVHLRNSTQFFAYTFFLSAVLNFVLGLYIFKEIPTNLDDIQRAVVLNEQISEMTWKSYIVIMVPSMACLMLLLRYLFKGIKEYTGLDFQEVLKNPPPES